MTYTIGHVDPWWDNSFKNLDYTFTSYTNPKDVERWILEGYPSTTHFQGWVYDMSRPLPEYAHLFLNLFGWETTTLSFFRMKPGEILPVHQDHYNTYRKIFNISDPKTIYRGIVFLEDWKSGHYFEVENHAIVNWQAGDFVFWKYNTPHMACNMGIEPRYTVQITGVNKN